MPGSSANEGAGGRVYREIKARVIAYEFPLQTLDAAARRKLPEFEPIAGVLNKLNRRALSNVDTLAAYTGEIFAHIASLSGNANVIDAIRHCNDHLYYIRTLECRHLQNVQSEVTLFCELLLGGHCEELQSAVHDYHDKRVELLPVLLDFLRG